MAGASTQGLRAGAALAGREEELPGSRFFRNAILAHRCNANIVTEGKCAGPSLPLLRVCGLGEEPGKVDQAQAEASSSPFEVAILLLPCSKCAVESEDGILFH